MKNRTIQLVSTISTVCLAGILLAAPASAAETKVAVAANFTIAAQEIAAAFKQATGDDAVLSFGSTGKLYTQIANGAPFEVFLSADQARPELAEKRGLAVPGSRFTYAKGKIVLTSADPKLVDDKGEVLRNSGSFQKLAIANPKTAPYGAAAVETMKALGVYDAIAPKIVEGENIAQTYQFVVTGNAQLGFAALSQVIDQNGYSKWVVPGNLYSPIRQDAVLLKTGADDATSKAFMEFLKGDKARAIIEKFGYGLD